jgi:cytochrome c
LDNFAYSEVIKAMAAEGGKWGYQELSEFLYKPTAYAKGTKMAFAGIKKPEERAALIAYLNTMSDSPLPAPEVKEAPAAEDATQPAADQAEESLKKAGDKPKQEVELPATSKVPAGTESNSDQPKKEFPEEENSTEKEQNKDADKQGETEKKGE